MCLGPEPSQNPAWASNPHGWDSNPAKTHGAWFEDLMKFSFLMSHHRKNSVRDNVIAKKWIFLERNALQRQSLGHLRGRLWQPQNGLWLVFMGWVISKANKWETYSNYLDEGWRSPEVGPQPTFCLLIVPWNCGCVI